MNQAIDQLLDEGFAHHQAGRLDDAEASYRRVLEVEPGHGEALHLLGLAAQMRGQSRVAVDLLRRAVAADPEAAEYHHNLGEALRATGELQAAHDAYAQAARLNPTSITSLQGLALTQDLLERYDDAAATWRRLIEVDPTKPEFFNNLGVEQRRAMRPQQSIESFRRALEMRPDYLEASKNLAQSLIDIGEPKRAMEEIRRTSTGPNATANALVALAIVANQAQLFDDAMEACRRALAIDPNLAEAHNALGFAFYSIGEFRGATLAFERAAMLRPDWILAYSNLGQACMATGQLQSAEVAFSKAAELDPNDHRVLYDLALAYERCGQFEKGLSVTDKILRIRPDLLRARSLAAMFHLRTGDVEQARKIYETLVADDPSNAEAWGKLGLVYAERGENDRALQAIDKAIALHPDPKVHSTYLFFTNSDPTIDPPEAFRRHADWGDRYGSSSAVAGAAQRPFANSRLPGKRIRIAYISPDFRTHSVSYFARAFLENHDRTRFEVFVYDDSPGPDITTFEFTKFVDRWRRIVGRSMQQVAETIREDQIDILIDLAGHSGDNRMLVFAERAAPVQVTYLGYPNTTGLRTIDYRITDELADPPGENDAWHTEKLVRLPNSFLCYTPGTSAPSIAGTAPAETAGHVTFASFNALTKVTPNVIDAWSRVLHAVPHSRLLIKGNGLGQPVSRQLYLDRFAAHGISADRLELIGKVRGYAEHLALYAKCDIGLDPFPYHGTTTTCEALWMGVPVITLAGRAHVSRVGVSILTNVGLPELIARSWDEYVEIAKSLAADPARIGQLRRGMRERMQQSSLMDVNSFIRNLESAYRTMWQTWCAAHAHRAEVTS